MPADHREDVCPLPIKKPHPVSNIENITKKFYSHFKKEYEEFLPCIQGIADHSDRERYTLLMLNRLMFLFFIQQKGFLANDKNYLWNSLKKVQKLCREEFFPLPEKQDEYNSSHSFYRYFLRRLFHEGLNKRERSPMLEQLLGQVPYLNSDLFDIHILELNNPDIQIPNSAFEKLFDFLQEYDWRLDDHSEEKKHREINPDILGSIFEQFINQKERGAYYTKKDVTDYISKNTIIPALFEATEKRCPDAFSPTGPAWSMLSNHYRDYIYTTVTKGIDIPLPAEIADGVNDTSKRILWNKPAQNDYALSTETWREVMARREHYEETLAKILTGNMTHIQDFTTHNLDISKFAWDVIASCKRPDLLLAFYESIESLTILDPTCGSGAFLFAALHILCPLYEICLTRMRTMVTQHNYLDSQEIERFHDILQKVQAHHNSRYFILRSIIIKNIYGVDLMEEAIEICKLRLFLNLIAQVDKAEDIEPFHDIDFNVFVGNTLLGFARLDEVRQMAVTSGQSLERIEAQTKDLEYAESLFQTAQINTDRAMIATYKQNLNAKKDMLRIELDLYLVTRYKTFRNERGIESGLVSPLAQPFHWYIEFYGIMKRGGFDVIIGNPPYVEYKAVDFPYPLQHFKTLPCANLYPCVVERSHQLLSSQGYQGMILPLAAFATRNMIPFIEGFYKWYPQSWLSFYHFRPSMLFSGGKIASIPTAIFLAKTNGPEQRFSTNLIKWSTDKRDQLFSRLAYCPITIARDMENRHYYPKLGHAIENTIMEKILRHQRIETFLAATPSHNTMWYRSAGGLYWKVFTNFPWPYETTSNKQCSFQEQYERDIFVALFNSSVFWWYYTVTFDTFNLKDYMLFGFRFSYPEDTTVMHSLRLCCQNLMNDFHANAQHLKRGTTGSYTVYARKSKHIIDKIDQILAGHYGFTEEEIDFIINYDIKYRLGTGSEPESET